jgi:hypothetical protein
MYNANLLSHAAAIGIVTSGFCSIPRSASADFDDLAKIRQPPIVSRPTARRSLSRAQRGQRVQPQRAAGVAWRDGRMIMLTDWVQLPATPHRVRRVYAYDCYEDDGAGAPWDDGNCTDIGLPISRDFRWYFGPTYNNPFVAGDMNTDSAGAGRQCDFVYHAWYWNIDDAGGAPYDDSDGDGAIDQDLYLAIFTTETSDPNGCSDDGTATAFPGVLYLFEDLNDTVHGDVPGQYYFANLDLSDTGLTHPMPADGAGGWLLLYGTAFDSSGGLITLSAGAGDVWAQPMLWGTGEDEWGPPRVGTQDFGQFDDDNPTDGTHDPVNECYDYTYGVCPDPLGGMIGFLYSEFEPCDCPGNLDGDDAVTLTDLALLLSRFGATDASECEDQNGDGRITLADLTILLAAFGRTCP